MDNIVPGRGPQTVAEHALDLSCRGFALFRLHRGSKDRFIDTDWASRQLADEWCVLEALSATPDCNLAVHAGASDLVIIDCDVKHGDGEALFRAMGELPPTFTVRTPSGGVHLYFRAGGLRFSQRPLERRLIDVRSGNGYVLAPGSTIDGKAYRVECDADPAPLPAWLLTKLVIECGTQRGEPGVCVELDTADAFAAANAYLERSAPSGRPGERNMTAVTVLQKLMDFGLSPESAAELAAERWQCEWSDDFTPEMLVPMAQRLSGVRQKPLGIEHPSAGFTAVAVQPVPQADADPFEAAVYRGRYDPAAAAAIPPRRWIAARHLVRGYMSLLIAPGGVGKTMLAMQWACAVASGESTTKAGVDFAGFNVVERAPVLVVNLEDPLDELRLRREAVVSHFQIDPYAIGDRVHLFSGAGFRHMGERWRIVRRDGGRVTRTRWVDDLMRYITRHGIGLVIIDPLTDAHEADESSNPEMSRVMDALREVVTETGCAMLVVHHTRKPPAASSDGFAGDPYSARGASAVLGAVRITHTLHSMSEKDAEANGVPESERGRYVRLDDAKANLFLLSHQAQWFERETTIAPNGEALGVLVPTWPGRAGAAAKVKAAVLAEVRAMDADGSLARTSASDQARNYLAKVLVNRPGLAVLGLDRGAIAEALAALEAEGSLRRVRSGRPRVKGDRPPQRFEFTPGCGAQSR